MRRFIRIAAKTLPSVFWVGVAGLCCWIGLNGVFSDVSDLGLQGLVPIALLRKFGQKSNGLAEKCVSSSENVKTSPFAYAPASIATIAVVTGTRHTKLFLRLRSANLKVAINKRLLQIRHNRRLLVVRYTPCSHLADIFTDVHERNKTPHSCET